MALDEGFDDEYWYPMRVEFDPPKEVQNETKAGSRQDSYPGPITQAENG